MANLNTKRRNRDKAKAIGKSKERIRAAGVDPKVWKATTKHNR